MTSDYVTVAEAAAIIGVTADWVRKLIRSGDLPATKVGQIYVITRQDAEALRDERKSPPSEAAGAVLGGRSKTGLF